VPTPGGLRELLENRPSESGGFDRATAIDRWKQALDELFSNIERWLSWLRVKGGDVERVQLMRHEDSLGVYDVQGLSVTVDRREFFFDPRRDVIGADGRIDLYEVGRVENTALLLYHAGDRSTPGMWEIRRKTDRLQGVPLDEQSLDQLLGQMLSAQ
jgi:hypothetical protein